MLLKTKGKNTLTSLALAALVFGCGGKGGGGSSAVSDQPVITPSVTGLSNNSTPAPAQNWSWNCSESNCSYRYAIDRSSTWTPSGSFGSTSSINYTLGAGTYYLHVQAQDASGTLSAPVTVSTVIHPAPAQIGSVGTSSHGLGVSGQRHTFLDSLTGYEWVFFLNSTDTGNIETSYNNGTSWQSGPTITLPTGAPHSSEGTQIAVDYRVLGGNGIAYVAYQYFSGNTVSLYEKRLQLTGSTFTAGTWSASLASSSGNLSPTIGLSVSILESGRLAMTSTALDPNFNFFAFNSNELDDGTTAVSTFTSGFDIATVNMYTRHAALFSSTADSAIAASDDAAGPTDGQFNNFYYGSFLNGTWTSPGSANMGAVSSVYMMPTAFSFEASYEDWAVTKVTDSELELVTRVDNGSPGALLHYRYTGGSWVSGQSIPNLAGIASSGLSLTSDGTNAWLFAIANDSAHSIQYIEWNPTSGWDSSWSVLESSTANRISISGAEFQGSGGVFFVNWIETGGALMSKLFGL